MAGSEQKRANDAPMLNRLVDGSAVNGVHSSTNGRAVSVALQDTARSWWQGHRQLHSER